MRSSVASRSRPYHSRRRIAQAEQRQRGHARIEVGAELTAGDALLDHVLDDALVAQLDRADALARRRGQEAPLAQEGEREVEPLGQRREVLEHQAAQPCPTALCVLRMDAARIAARSPATPSAHTASSAASLEAK